MINHIFVYGTLRPGHGANDFLRGCHHVGTFRYEGAVMFSLGGFPGIHLLPDCEREQSIIVGDLYRFDDPSVLDTLDGYEGFNRHDPDSSLYLRKEIEINGCKSFIYEYNGTPKANARVESGDWEDATSLYRRG